jgi:hypothetical protein
VISRLWHFLGGRFEDSCEVANLTLLQPLIPGKNPVSHSCHRLRKTQDHSAAGRILSVENFDYIIGSRNSNLSASSVAPQSITPPYTPPIVAYPVLNDWIRSFFFPSVLSVWWPPLWSSGQSFWIQNGDVLCFLWGTNWIYICYVEESKPPLWFSDQSSLQQIRRSGFDSRHYQIFWEVLGLITLWLIWRGGMGWCGLDWSRSG